MKKIARILLKALVAIIILIVAGSAALSIPSVQTELGRRVVGMLPEEFRAAISFSDVKLQFPGAVVLKDLTMVDTDPYRDSLFSWSEADTVFYARLITASINAASIFGEGSIRIDRAKVRDGWFHFTIEPNPYSNNINRILGKVPGGDRKGLSRKDILMIRSLEVENFRYIMHSYRQEALQHKRKEPSINYNDMDVLANVRAHNFSISGGYVKAVADHIDLLEKSGYHAGSIKGKVCVGFGKVAISDLKILDDWSSMDCDYSMSFSAPDAFGDFTDSVTLSLQAGESYLSPTTINYFAGSAIPESLGIRISSADITGPVNGLEIKSLVFAEEYTGIKGRLGGSLKNIEHPSDARIDATLRQLSYSHPDFTSGHRAGGTLRIKGSGSHLKADGNFHLDKGLLAINADARHPLSDKREIYAEVSTDKLDLSLVTGLEQLSECTMESSLSMGDGKLRIDSLHCTSLSALGHEFSDIRASAWSDRQNGHGKITVADSALNATLNVFAKYDSLSNNFSLSLDIVDADLKEMGFDKRGDVSRIAARMNIQAINTSNGNLLTVSDIRGIDLINGRGSHKIGDIGLTAHFADGSGTLKLDSDFATAYFNGKLPNQFDFKDFGISADIFDCQQLLDFLAPGLYISQGSHIDFSADKEGKMRGSAECERLAFGKDFLKDFSIDISDRGDSSRVHLQAAQAVIKGIPAENASLIVRGLVELGKESSFDAVIDSSSLTIAGTDWEFVPGSVSLRDGNFSFSSIGLRSGTQYLGVDGGISKEKQDTLRLKIDRFKLDIANAVASSDLGIGGTITGYGAVYSPSGLDGGLLVNAGCDSLRVQGKDYGTIRLSTSWDDKEKLLGFRLRNFSDDIVPLNLRGSFRPEDKSISADCQINSLNLGIIEPFTSDIFSELKGTASGDIRISGRSDSLIVMSRNAGLKGVRLRVAATGAAYNIDGPFGIDKSGLSLDDLSVKDDYHGTAHIKGRLLYSDIKNMSTNLKIELDNLRALDLEPGSLPYSGHINLSGSAGLNGPLSSLLINADLRTGGGGNLAIVTQAGAEAETSKLLRFVQPVPEDDPYDIMIRRLESVKPKKKQGDLQIKARLAISPDVSLKVALGEGSGNEISGNGSGNINADIIPSRQQYTFEGDYNMSGGDFLFSIPSLVSRNFSIRSGSSVKLSGNILDSELDIDAVYNASATLSAIIRDSSSTRRTVECGINISDKLRNPNLGLTINVPDLDPTTKSMLESALNTEDKIQKQFIALLAFNSFLPDEASGIVNGTSMIYSNAVQILASQFNSILKKLEIPVDLGFNYQPTSVGTDIFDVAISTKLFNDRVILNGNFGNRTYKTTSSPNGDMAGDLDIEIKLGNAGQFRLNLFSHSADEYTSYLDFSQRNGIGLSYQKEYTSFGELIRNLLKRKKKPVITQTEEIKTIIIQND